MAVVALLALCMARPTVASCACGLLVSLGGESLRLWALGYTGKHTRAQSLEAPSLITTGPYALVRNPLYLGNFLNSLGIVIACIGGLSGFLSCVLVLFSVLSLVCVYGACISVEEAFLLERFGEPYARYLQRVPALIPSLGHLKQLGPCSQWQSGGFSLKSCRYEYSTLSWLCLIWSYLWLRAIC